MKARGPRLIEAVVQAVRRTLLARAGHLTRPPGKLTLTLNANPTVPNALLRFLQV
jgi:hypothetical protein